MRYCVHVFYVLIVTDYLLESIYSIQALHTLYMKKQNMEIYWTIYNNTSRMTKSASPRKCAPYRVLKN